MSVAGSPSGMSRWSHRSYPSAVRSGGPGDRAGYRMTYRTPVRYRPRRAILWSPCPTSSSSPPSSRPATSRRRSTSSSTGLQRGARHQTLLGATGTGKTATLAWTIETDQPADARPRPQQDARRPALRRVPGVLPRQRGRVLRQLLRLLPAGGVPAPERHVHREGLEPERRDRPAPPRGHPRAVRAARRDHRRLGLVHLRPRGAGRLRGDRPPPPKGRAVPAGLGPAPPRRSPVPAQRPGADPCASSGSAATPSSSSPPPRSTWSGSSSSATRSSGSRSWTR